MAFKTVGTLAPNAGTQLIGGDTAPQLTIVANSQVAQIGDKCEWDADGFIVAGASSTATIEPVGIIVAFAANGIATDFDASSLDTVTVASDNETVAKIYAIIDVSEYTLYSVAMDAALGATTGSGLPGYSMDALASDGSQLDESTAETSVTGSVSFHSWGVDPVDALRVIVNMKQGAHHKLIS